MAREREGEREVPTIAAEPTQVTLGPGKGMQAVQQKLAEGNRDAAAFLHVLDLYKTEVPDIIRFLNAAPGYGNAFVAEILELAKKLRVNIKGLEAVYGVPGSGDDYFLANKNGAEFQALNGDLTGTVGKRGLNANYTIDENDSLAINAGGREASVGWVHNGRTEAELYGRRTTNLPAQPSAIGVGVRRPFEAGGGNGSYGIEYRHNSEAGAVVGTAGWRDNDTRLEGYAGVNTNGRPVAGFNAEQDFTNGTGYVRGALGDQQYGVTAGGSMNINPNTRIYGELGLTGALAGTGVQPSLTAGISHRSQELVAGADISARGDATGQVYSLKGFADFRLGDNLFANVNGSVSMDHGQTTAEVGGGLAYTLSEKNALVLSGAFDEQGRARVELGFEQYSKAINSVLGLSDARRKQLIGVYLFYQQGGGPSGNYTVDRPLNVSPGGTAGIGVRVRF